MSKRQNILTVILLACLVVVGCSMKIVSTGFELDLGNSWTFLIGWVLCGFGSGHMAMKWTKNWTTQKGCISIILGPIGLMFNLIVGWLDGRFGKRHWNL